MTDSRHCQLVTAMVTPFKADLSIDEPALTRLTHHLIETGSDGLLVNGSTGENPTLSVEEKLQVLRIVKTTIGDRPIALIAGTGSNDTAGTIAFTKLIIAEGVDAVLVVVPYYNKPSQAGLKAHFGAVAEAIGDTPLIIYNIPSRVTVNILPETVAALASSHNNIIGIKQSHTDMDQVSEIRLKAPTGFRIWCGDDSLTLPMMTLGACGLISVASHVIGRSLREMIVAFQAGDHQRALQLHLKQFEIFRELFFLPNPTVLKACMSQLGLIEPYLRLPLVPPEPTDMSRIAQLVTRIQGC